jgi:putative transposase
MPEYRRNRVPGGTYFFTVNLRDRHSDLLTSHIAVPRDAVGQTRRKHPFHIDAWVVLPEHMHCLWTLPPGDRDYSRRWKAIKWGFCVSLPATEARSAVRHRRGERGIWQRRFWEHTIRDDADYAAHMDYVHFNPVRYGLVSGVSHWPYSSFRRCVAAGVYPVGWGGGPPNVLLGNKKKILTTFLSPCDTAAMDHTPSTAVPDCPTAADTCQCRPAACTHCGAGQPSEAALRHRRNLAEIGEAGMELVRQIRKQTREMGVLGYQGAQMFDQISRAVRRAHALEAKIEADGLKTDAQRAAAWSRQDAAAQRADRPIAATAKGAKPRKRNILLNDLRDRDDTMSDLDDLDDLSDGADDEDRDDERTEATVGATINSLNKTLGAVSRQLDAARAAAAGDDQAEADDRGSTEPESAEPSAIAAAHSRVAFAVAGNKFRRTHLPLTPIPPAMAWPPPASAAHDPPP